VLRHRKFGQAIAIGWTAAGGDGASAIGWMFSRQLALPLDVAQPSADEILSMYVHGVSAVMIVREGAMQMSRAVRLLSRIKGISTLSIRYLLNTQHHTDLGWDRTVSTVAFKGGLKGYYQETEQLAKRGGA